ncbi:MAG TPA: glycosyltransferase family 4 protein [Opitutaceae bacterium]|nr:glycosyltransferase family 4 protein [Opitutaceae bacterium]
MAKRLVFLSVVPSPYQRDVFRALAARGRISLQVHYLERAAPDSPWPEPALAAWENILPGIVAGRGRWRSHLNWRVPRPRADETWIVNGAMTDLTTQRFIRCTGGHVPWLFWGELPSQPRGAWKRWLQRRQYAPLRRARAIVAVGERARAAYARLAPDTPVFNRPYACRLEAFAAAAAHRPRNPEPVFLFCGQMIARKGVDVLLRAFARLAHEGVAARLLLVGREADLPRFLAPLAPEIRARVSYAGFLPPDDLPAQFARADVFVLPSRHDGWGVVVNQAFGAGLPVICSDAVGAGLDLVQPERNGLLVAAGDESALAAAMRRFATSPALREACGAGAVRTASTLAPEHAAEFWEELAEKIAPRT